MKLQGTDVFSSSPPTSDLVKRSFNANGSNGSYYQENRVHSANASSSHFECAVRYNSSASNYGQVVQKVIKVENFNVGAPTGSVTYYGQDQVDNARPILPAVDYVTRNLGNHANYGNHKSEKVVTRKVQRSKMYFWAGKGDY